MKKAFFSFGVAVFFFTFCHKNIFAQSFTFTAAGDFNLGARAQSVTSAMDTGSNFSLALGDFAYGGPAADFCTMVRNGTSSTYPFELIAGNHDTGESDPNIMPALVSCLPHRAGTAATGTYGHSYYFDYPATSPLMRVIMVRPGVSSNGSIAYNAGSLGFNFVSNAIDDARARGIRWIAVGMHKNYISMLTKSNELGADFMPMLFSKRVDLILQGHEHGYERTKQLRCAIVGRYDASCVADTDNQIVKGAGSTIIVLGTGGQGFRGANTADTEAQYFAHHNVTAHGYGKFVVSATSIQYNFATVSGIANNDSFVISDPQFQGSALPGDANNDRKVDGVDYVVWLNNFGRITTLRASGGDFNFDGKVDGVDYVVWLNNFGRTG